jgi:hypothetical protein
MSVGEFAMDGVMWFSREASREAERTTAAVQVLEEMSLGELLYLALVEERGAE